MSASIAGYDLLNEPVTSKSIDQWQKLAQQLVDGIRSVDQNHLIIVERLNATGGKWNNDNNFNFFLVNDPQNDVMYTFHFYSPIEYTHQYTGWTKYKDLEGGRYPDLKMSMYPADLQWKTCTYSNPALPQGDNDWSEYVGIKYTVTDPSIITALPAFQSKGNSGTVYFDDFTVIEYDPQGKSSVLLDNINLNSTDGSYFWVEDGGSGNCTITPTEGHNDKVSLQITGTNKDTNCSYRNYRFSVKPGYSYQIKGYMKGVSVTGINTRIRLDFEKSPSGKPVLVRDKSYLENALKPYLDWGKANNVPLYIGEFGLFHTCFENDSARVNRGGLTWVSDLMDLFKSYGVSFTYHDYHETGFGLYRSNPEKELPADPNQSLIDLITDKLSNQPTSKDSQLNLKGTVPTGLETH